MIYLYLFWEFFKIGIFSLGGMTTLPFFFDIADKYDWFSAAELTDIIAVSQSLPGAIAINMSAYAGYQGAGIAGALIASTAMILPAIIISILVCKVIVSWRKNKYVEMIFSGLRPAIAGLLLAVSISLISLAVCGTKLFGPESLFNYKSLIFLLIITPIVFKFKKSPLLFVALGAAVGLVFQL
jgi:chromate transporter